MTDASLTVELPIELTNGNDGRGGRWYKSANVRKKLEVIIRELGHVREPFAAKVRIVITRVLGKGQRLWDPDSIGRGNAKELVDALVACGWFHDDSPKYVSTCDYRQDESLRADGPYVVVEVQPVLSEQQSILDLWEYAASIQHTHDSANAFRLLFTRIDEIYVSNSDRT